MTIKTLLWFGSIFLILAVAATGAEDLSKKYVGKSDCVPELSTASHKYGVRLDRTQVAYLSSYTLKDEDMLTIVQYGQEGDKCGVIRDVILAQHKDDSFVWECVNRRSPSAVVVGTWPAEHPKPRGPAVEAWRIDLKELKFIRVEQASRLVYCRLERGGGNDDGLGLSDYAKKRTGKYPSN
jgi:hypothetical protein